MFYFFLVINSLLAYLHFPNQVVFFKHIQSRNCILQTVYAMYDNSLKFAK